MYLCLLLFCELPTSETKRVFRSTPSRPRLGRLPKLPPEHAGTCVGVRKPADRNCTVWSPFGAKQTWLGSESLQLLSPMRGLQLQTGPVAPITTKGSVESRWSANLTNIDTPPRMDGEEKKKERRVHLFIAGLVGSSFKVLFAPTCLSGACLCKCEYSDSPVLAACFAPALL